MNNGTVKKKNTLVTTERNELTALKRVAKKQYNRVTVNDIAEQARIVFDKKNSNTLFYLAQSNKL